MLLTKETMQNCLKCKSCRLIQDYEFRIFCQDKRMDVAVMVAKKDLEEEASIPEWCPLQRIENESTR